MGDKASSARQMHVIEGPTRLATGQSASDLRLDVELSYERIRHHAAREVRRLGSDLVDPDDVSHATVLRLLSGIGRGATPARHAPHHDGWLALCVRNVTRNEVRKELRHTGACPVRHQPQFALRVSHLEDGPLDCLSMLRELELPRVTRAQESTIVLLALGLPVAEIALLPRSRVGVIRGRIQRALHLLTAPGELGGQGRVVASR